MTEAALANRMQEAEALIAHILRRYHAVHRLDLLTLLRLARRVEQEHAGHPACPRGLANFLENLRSELEQHMDKEETVLFPTLLAGAAGCAPFALRRMRAEHDDHHVQLRELCVIAGDFVCPPDADEVWRSLCAGCAKLHDDLTEHIRIENDELFPLFE